MLFPKPPTQEEDEEGEAMEGACPRGCSPWREPPSSLASKGRGGIHLEPRAMEEEEDTAVEARATRPRHPTRGSKHPWTTLT